MIMCGPARIAALRHSSESEGAKLVVGSGRRRVKWNKGQGPSRRRQPWLELQKVEQHQGVSSDGSWREASVVFHKKLQAIAVREVEYVVQNQGVSSDESLREASVAVHTKLQA